MYLHPWIIVGVTGAVADVVIELDVVVAVLAVVEA